jgi:hypothetical protein
LYKEISSRLARDPARKLGTFILAPLATQVAFLVSLPLGSTLGDPDPDKLVLKANRFSGLGRISLSTAQSPS